MRVKRDPASLVSCIITVFFATFGTSCTDAQRSGLPLRQIADVALTGRASRLDYQSLDAENGRLYIAHLGDSMLTVFDVRTQKVVGDVKDLKNVHGVLAVPELHRVYASATGSNELAVIDDQTLQVIARVPTGSYPDGIAYASAEKKLYVSNKNGKSDTVIDSTTNRTVGTISLDAEAGNSQYDAVSDRIFVALGERNQIVEIDPRSDSVLGGYDLTGCEGAHGLYIDGRSQIAYVACEDNGKLAAFDLGGKKLISVYSVGRDPDVLAFDTALRRLYVASESGTITIFKQTNERKLEIVADGDLASRAHTVAVDSSTHRVYFPLESVDGKPVLRIVVPADVTP
jgi:YVTN family beta-propeller protein